ncbi:MAG: hypothetical protein HY699_02740 [Deltaproteobacteria bacterium]|nr:hypothetical protein [Deltaproteobacteria bacterium]
MRWWECVFVLLALAVAACLRLQHLDATAFSVDEINDLVVADQPLARLPAAVARQTGATPLHALLTHWIIRRHGRSEQPARALAAAFGALTVVAMFVAGRVLFGQAPWIAIALLVISAPHISAGREVQAAALSGLLSTVLLAAAAHGLQAPSRGAWVVLVISGALALYGHYGAALVWAAVIIVSFIAWWGRALSTRALLFVATAAAAALLWFTPWLWLDYHGGRGGALFVTRVTPATFTALAQRLAAGTQRLPPYWGLILAAAAGLGVLRGVVQRRLASALLSTGIAFAVAGTLIATSALPYPFDPHQVLFVLPLYLLLAGRGFEWALTPAPSRVQPWLTAAAAAAVVAAGGWVLRAPTGPAGPDWRAVAAVVGNNAWAEDTVAAPEVREALLFYAPALRRQLLPEMPARLLASALPKGPRSWLVVPLSVRLGAAWPQLMPWSKDANVLDLSAGNDPLILYAGRTGRDQLLREVATFDLPVASLARGSWLRELLQLTGPLRPLLRFIDQLAAAPEGAKLRNPELLGVVSLLARNGERDRARALAARLAQEEPDWLEAQQALAALQ